MNQDGFLHTINVFLAGKLFYLLLAVLLLNIIQRRHQGQTQAKRFATLYLAVLVLVLMAGTILIVYFRLPDLLLVPLAAALILIGYLNRRHVFPFRLRCRNCGAPLGWERILYFDDNTCEGCAAPRDTDRPA